MNNVTKCIIVTFWIIAVCVILFQFGYYFGKEANYNKGYNEGFSAALSVNDRHYKLHIQEYYVKRSKE